MTIIVIKINIAIYAGNPFTTVAYGLLKIAQAVKILHPNGGDTEPIAACSVIRIPR